jgi:tRNA dimethylallyltransferase
MQVYRGLDIGTAKPDAALLATLPHHLLDLRDPDEQYNAGDFVKDARAACADIAKRGALPVVSGGSGFYLSNLINGLPEAPPSDASIREALKQELADKGREALVAELEAVDPISAARIHANDTYRLLRALEVWRLTGQPLSAFARNARQADADPWARFIIVGLERERDDLYARIEKRVDEMFAMGLVDEVRGLAAKGWTPDNPGLRAIGYREFFEQNNGVWTLRDNVDAIKAQIILDTRHYAKRQLTWFRKVEKVTWLQMPIRTSLNSVKETLARKLAAANLV